METPFNDDLCRKLFETAQQLETLIGKALDIEWTYSDQILHILHPGPPHELCPLAAETLDSHQIRHCAPVSDSPLVQIDALAHLCNPIISCTQR